MSVYNVGWAVVPDDFGRRTLVNAPGVGIDVIYTTSLVYLTY